MYDDIVFWKQTCSGQLLVDLVTLGPKAFRNKDEPFAPTVRPEENSPRVMLQLVLQNPGECIVYFVIIVAVLVALCAKT